MQSILENNKDENSTEIFNLSAPAIPMNVIVETIAEALNRKIPGIRMPVAAPLWTLPLRLTNPAITQTPKRSPDA